MESKNVVEQLVCLARLEFEATRCEIARSVQWIDWRAFNHEEHAFFSGEDFGVVSCRNRKRKNALVNFFKIPLDRLNGFGFLLALGLRVLSLRLRGICFL